MLRAACLICFWSSDAATGELLSRQCWQTPVIEWGQGTCQQKVARWPQSSRLNAGTSSRSLLGVTGGAW